MGSNRAKLLYHILALVTIFVWGTTFVSTKVLLTHGLTPPEIMLYRFIIAYALTWPFTRKLRADNWADELYLAVAGFTGGTLYFLAENTAIDYSITSNVALVVCVTPVLTALLTSLCYKERITGRLIIGSAVALLGVGFVILNGTVLKIHPLGDALALVAALAWAVYSVVVRRFDGKYTTWFVTRKVFFYGIVTMIPFMAAGMGGGLHPDKLTIPVVVANVLFLSVVASMLCFYSWNLVLEKIGTIRASNYMYSQPLVSLACSVAVLGEPITHIALLGTALILVGIYVAERK
ncbi:MAG: DMT family transporter [Bacteroidales bacterium]|nr:DMT family transporter [Bacteroidales bacterium]